MREKSTHLSVSAWVVVQLDDHLGYKTTCQEYKDCPLQCQDQACKDRCLLKTCYYYHCSTYKTCFDACFDKQDCQAQCSYKGCDYGLLNNIQGQLDQVSSCRAKMPLRVSSSCSISQHVCSHVYLSTKQLLGTQAEYMIVHFTMLKALSSTKTRAA